MTLEDIEDEDGTEDGYHLNESELSVGNITSIASQIKGLEEMDNNEIQEWIECDRQKTGYQIINDDYLNRESSDTSSDDDANCDDNDCVIKTSHREARDAVNVLIQYFEEQPGAYDIHVLQLRKMKEIIKCRSYEAQKQTKISDFFK